MTTDWVRTLTHTQDTRDAHQVRPRKQRPKPKPTPGPWQQHEGMPWEVVDADGVLVTSVQRCDCLIYARMHDEAAEENARLISAAPDLLAACEVLLDAVDRGDHKDKALRTARAAVAKARGEP